MSGFVTYLASLMCLLVILTGTSSALFWRPVVPTYPADPNDPFYTAFQTVPPPVETAKKLLTSFLSFRTAGTGKRSTTTEDIVIVMDGSQSIYDCNFKKGKEALKHMMKTLNNPRTDTKYAAVTFSRTATVNFKFLPYSLASRKITEIPYPNSWTNTQAGLAEAKKLFDDSTSGRRDSPDRKMVLLVTDGRSNIKRHLTVPNAKALKESPSDVEIYVVAVGDYYMNGIDEMVKVASSPPEEYLFRVKDYASFWKVVKMAVKEIAPDKYKVVDYDPPCK